MTLLLLEALGAMLMLIFIVWWTMFSGRKKGELHDDPDDDPATPTATPAPVPRDTPKADSTQKPTPPEPGEPAKTE